MFNESTETEEVKVTRRMCIVGFSNCYTMH